MKRIVLHSLLALFVASASLAEWHHHERSDRLAFVDESQRESDCAFCAMKSALRDWDASPCAEPIAPLVFSVLVQPPLSSPLWFVCSAPPSSRAPPQA